MAGGNANALRMTRGGDAARLCLEHLLLLLLVVTIACLCLASMAAAQTPARPAASAAALAANETAIDEDARVRAAIVEAVRARMGQDVEVTLSDPRVRVSGILPVHLLAVPDIGAHAGGSVRFVLFDRDGEPTAVSSVSAAPHGGGARGSHAAAGPAGVGARRIGSVDVELHIEAEQLRAVAPIARGAEITAADVESVVADAGRVPLKPLPPVARALGAKAARDIAPGQIITTLMLVVSPLVRSGDEVRTRVRMGGLEARGLAVAAQNGALGDEILVVNADSRRRLKGRVVGKREVEVLH